MSELKDREKAFENQFAHASEMEFKTIARRNKLLGLWAAEKLGKSGDEAQQYAKDVVMADLESAGHDDVIAKLLKDFGASGVAVPVGDIQKHMADLLLVARKQILG